MAFGFRKSRTRPVGGVAVTSAQVAAAKLMIERAAVSNKAVDEAVVAIANAEPVPDSTEYTVVPSRRPGPVAPDRSASS